MKIACALALVCVAGCELVFPLRGPDDVPDPLEAPHLVPRVVDDAPVLAGSATAIELQVEGHPSALVAYRVTASTGTLAAETGVIQLSEVGLAVATLSWTAPDAPAAATLTFSSGYDAVDEANQVTLEIPVAKRLGNPNGEMAFQLLGPSALLAIPISTPVASRVAELAVNVGPFILPPARAMVGIYASSNGRPTSLIVATPMLDVPASGMSIARVAAPVDQVLAAGDYWLVVGSDATVLIGGSDTSAQEALTGTGSFPLPSSFTGGTTVFGLWALDTTVFAQP